MTDALSLLLNPFAGAAIISLMFYTVLMLAFMLVVIGQSFTKR